MFGLLDYIYSIPRPLKRTLIICSDTILIPLSYWLALSLRLGEIQFEISLNSIIILSLITPITIATFFKFSLYRGLVRYMAERSIALIVVGGFLSSAVMFACNQLLGLGIPRSVPGIYFVILVFNAGGMRFVLRSVYLLSVHYGREPIAIYGAGVIGRQLLRSLQEDQQYKVLFFIDDDPSIQGSLIGDIRVLSYEKARPFLDKQRVKTVAITISEKNEVGRQTAASLMFELGMEVRMVPKLYHLSDNELRISELNTLNIEDLLGRNIVPPIKDLLVASIQSKSVLVSGAGGSIGSELCEQILKQAPSQIILLELSEFALFSIHEKLLDVATQMSSEANIIPILGTVADSDLLRQVILENNVQVFFHAAAYKHVPLTELNVKAAIDNNVMAGYNCLKVAGELGLERVVVISTDKAVRPTNIMGATKRLVELTMMHMAKKFPNTKYCAVRFGNVLGSSGSVVPKFKRQIENGGPISLTHPDITRYFMTISEAAELVIQASAIAERGEVFLLDMGAPVRILDLAITMCKLNGKKSHLSDSSSIENGSIEIKVTGLRAGEKLYEELLVNGKKASTVHPKIFLEEFQINVDIDNIISNLKNKNNISEIKEILEKSEIGYNSEYQENLPEAMT